MALTTVQDNNKLVVYTKEINREFVRENLFSPYMGQDLTSIIRIKQELKSGGDQMNIPLVTKLRGRGTGTGTLVGNEEKIDNYGFRLWIDWARHAVVTKKSETQKESADIFGEAKPLLSDWGKERQRDDIVSAFMSLPKESAPAGLGSDPGNTVNGILYEDATAAERNTWNAANSDRVLYGKLVSNYNATHATALANVDTTDDKLSAAIVSLAKRRAMNANPAIRPYKTRDGYEYYVMFAGTNSFRDLSQDATIIAANKDARAREGNGMDKNPIFQDGDLIYNGVIIRQVPEISSYVTNVWTTLKTAGASSARVEPVFLCGQQALVLGWGQMAKPTFRKEDDYGFITGVGTEMAYGVAKLAKKHPMDGSNLVQWGVVTVFVAAAEDA
jgi:N4-gp56 family major capsid protein